MSPPRDGCGLTKSRLTSISQSAPNGSPSITPNRRQLSGTNPLWVGTERSTRSAIQFSTPLDQTPSTRSLVLSRMNSENSYNTPSLNAP